LFQIRQGAHLKSALAAGRARLQRSHAFGPKRRYTCLYWVGPIRRKSLVMDQSAPMRLLIVEDGPRLPTFLRKGLTENGFVVDVANAGDDGLHNARKWAEIARRFQLSSPSVGFFRADTQGCCPKNPDQRRGFKRSHRRREEMLRVVQMYQEQT
jgi:hypothetical protein